MNIFEKYGSYEAVKQAAVNYKNSGDMVTAAGLELQCLEYRRQHNIFEVGDKVVLLGDGTWGHLFEVEKMSPKGRKPTKLKTDVFGNFHVGYNVVRHATPEEIAAGRRL